MTIRPTPPVSLSDVMAELRVTNPGRAYPISLGDADVRGLAGIPSGPISLSDLYGKSAVPPFSVTARDAWDSANTMYGPGTVSCAPGVNIIGGAGSTSCTWEVLSNPMGCTVTLGTGPSVTISYRFRQNENGYAEVRLRCTVIDQAGQQRTVDVVGTLEWYGIR